MLYFKLSTVNCRKTCTGFSTKCDIVTHTRMLILKNNPCIHLACALTVHSRSEDLINIWHILYYSQSEETSNLQFKHDVLLGSRVVIRNEIEVLSMEISSLVWLVNTNEDKAETNLGFFFDLTCRTSLNRSQFRSRWVHNFVPDWNIFIETGITKWKVN